MTRDSGLEQAVWTELETGAREAGTTTLPEAIARGAPLYFDPRFGCFTKEVYRALLGKPVLFRYVFGAVRRPDGVKVVGDIDEAAATSHWRKSLTAAPAASFFYRIQSGDTLIDVARRAYGATPDYWGPQYINFHPFNRRLWRTDLTNARLWPGGRVSFSPRFAADLDTQVTTLAGVASAPRGPAYGVLFIPPARFEAKIDRTDLLPGRKDVVEFDVTSSVGVTRIPPPR
jgi:hypothetical protein